MKQILQQKLINFLPKEGSLSISLQELVSSDCSPLVVSLTPKQLNNFFDRIVVCDNGCWEWCGEIQKQGYGVFSIKSKRQIASKFSWRFFNGEVPHKMVVCHKCDNPPCVNPEHLFIGTQKDNIRDMINKGRNRTGVNHPQAVLEEHQIKEICKLYKSKNNKKGFPTHKDLANKFNVHHNTIKHTLKRYVT